ncbi:Coq4 family protein [Parahaliea mediterranea]|uniref:Coq4 family protein n=1 Tax=Parahaliea mediterranea TaxID=651086 RepID=UPI000E2EA50E|nr:Coq4 family protein [Parahaliea mediterranea]
MNSEESAYLKGGIQPLTTRSSVLVSSSKYLNSAALRHVVAQEMLRKVGNDLPPAYFIPEMGAAFAEVSDTAKTLALFQQERASNPVFARWLDAGFVSDFSAERLRAHQPGTLGERVYRFVVDSGLDIDFMFKGAPENDHQYWLKRFIQSHDIQHMITGFDVSPLGEYALIMLNSTNYYDHFSPHLAAELSMQTTLQVASGWMRATLHYPATLGLFWEAMDLARRMARALPRPLFYERWEDYWDLSIPEIRQQLGITEAPAEGAWDWAWQVMRDEGAAPADGAG